MAEALANLAQYQTTGFNRGKPIWVEWIWRVASALIFQSPLFPFYGLKRQILRLFGARIGRGVLIKPRVSITFPWRLILEDHCWIGEGVWLDSLGEIRIGPSACISQGAYLCTGNHDYKKVSFDLLTAPISVGRSAWVAAQSRVAPGVTIGEGAVLAFASVAMDDLEPRGIYLGHPAQKIATRA